MHALLGNRRVEGVLLTHAHFDHIYGLPSLIEKFPDVAIYTNEWGKRALADDKLNMSRYHEAPVKVDCSNVRVVKEGGDEPAALRQVVGRSFPSSDSVLVRREGDLSRA